MSHYQLYVVDGVGSIILLPILQMRQVKVTVLPKHIQRVRHDDRHRVCTWSCTMFNACVPPVHFFCGPSLGENTEISPPSPRWRLDWGPRSQQCGCHWDPTLCFLSSLAFPCSPQKRTVWFCRVGSSNIHFDSPKHLLARSQTESQNWLCFHHPQGDSL